jgi:hypothetical protein
MSETDSEPKTKADVYRDRNLLAVAFIRALPGPRRYGWWPDTDDVNGEKWAVVWAQLPTGQVGWHVPRDMVPDHFPMCDPEYDGYTTEEKNDRLAEFAGVDR